MPWLRFPHKRVLIHKRVSSPLYQRVFPLQTRFFSTSAFLLYKRVSSLETRFSTGRYSKNRERLWGPWGWRGSEALMVMIEYLIVLAVLVLVVESKECKWKKRDDAPEVYWINMDKSIARRKNMERHLDEIGFRHFRVRGLTPKEIYIPDDIESTWRTAACQLETSWKPPPMSIIQQNTSSEYARYTSYTASLCGRGKKKNTPKELGCTTSHLMAMYRAIYSKTAKSRYALIVEDDVQFPFDIDYNLLTASAPSDFGILQLFNSNLKSMERTWSEYQSKGPLWTLRTLKQFDYWSTCAYLIDRQVMKPVIDAILRLVSGWWEFKVVAGITSPCVPRGCCGNTSSTSNTFIHSPPCVYAPQGYQADSYLYATTSTYMITVPVIANGLGTNQSTFHQDHVELLHKNAFRQQRHYINQMLEKKVTVPEFIKPACNELLDVNLV
jgi:GR25 family glycosyltransferase involved in LPS biosynthesis